MLTFTYNTARTISYKSVPSDGLPFKIFSSADLERDIQ